ncbi:hypothetical protein N657DRAFT_640787 [Parathielavia appendiculata]|uniref:Uncharacterized protein n=1 Tax=Parathielavia appendiculata TaxID=2587402 RepID=A0AAN6U5M4_9PEZI|nr:hypothetical protein N657DRAFT_640787 [Parathielavia appendiculata]
MPRGEHPLPSFSPWRIGPVSTLVPLDSSRQTRRAGVRHQWRGDAKSCCCPRSCCSCAPLLQLNRVNKISTKSNRTPVNEMYTCNSNYVQKRLFHCPEPAHAIYIDFKVAIESVRVNTANGSSSIPIDNIASFSVSPGRLPAGGKKQAGGAPENFRGPAMEVKVNVTHHFLRHLANG